METKAREKKRIYKSLIGTVAARLSGNICFEFSVLFLCSVGKNVKLNKSQFRLGHSVYTTSRGSVLSSKKAFVSEEWLYNVYASSIWQTLGHLTGTLCIL
jgi:hypothetical protein